MNAEIELNEAWEELKRVWNDETSQNFESNYFQDVLLCYQEFDKAFEAFNNEKQDTV